MRYAGRPPQRLGCVTICYHVPLLEICCCIYGEMDVRWKQRRHRMRRNKGSNVIMTSPSLCYEWVSLGGPNKARRSLSRSSGSRAICGLPFRTDWRSGRHRYAERNDLSIAIWRCGYGHGTFLSTPIRARH